MARIPVNMPKMSMTMETGTLVEWSVAVGDQVRDGDVLCVVTTDKVDMDVEAVANGTVAELVINPGDVLPVGQPMAWLESESEDLLGDLFASPIPAAGTQASDSPPEAEQPAAVAPDAAQPVAEIADEEDAPVRAVPLARTLAKEHGIDLRQVKGTGPHHVVRARDVREAIEARDQSATVPAEQAAVAAAPAAAVAAPVAASQTAPAAPRRAAGGGTDRRSRIRQATAKVMVASASIPQFTSYRTMDLTATARARKAGLKGVSWTTIMVRAYAMTLEQHPAMNGSWSDDGVVPNPEIVVSLAVDTPDGLLAPAVRNPQTMSMKALDAQIREMAARLKEGDTDPELFIPGTGTVSNLGGMGVERFNAILTPPQATALSLGAVEHKVGVDADGEIAPYLGCTVGLALDHRVADGADAARFLATLQEFLADPILLLA